MAELLLATVDTFSKVGHFVPRGTVVSSDEVDYVEGVSTNLIPAPAGISSGAVVQVSAIAPTGPNPTAPQQIAPGVVQTSGGYVESGATLIGEVTVSDKQRVVIVGDPEDDTQAIVAQALADHDALGGNVANEGTEGTEGTVADFAARADTADAAELDRLEAAENDREVPRKGALTAIDKRRQALASA